MTDSKIDTTKTNKPYLFVLPTLAILIFLCFPILSHSATCGCEPVVDTCGIINGTDIPPPPMEITAPEVYCNDCTGALPDHCGVCGGCQDPFYSCNYTVTRTSGGLVNGNQLGSLASLSMTTIACGQFHKADPDIAPSRASGIWTFRDEPGVPCNPIEIQLTNVSGNALGHSSDASPNFLIVGNPEVIPKEAYIYGKTEFPLFSKFFTYEDPCGGNQFGWDVAVDEETGFAAVSDPRAHFTGSVWIFQITSPSVYQNITVGEKDWQFGYSIDMHDGELVVGVPGCDSGEDGAGCLYFYSYNETSLLFEENIAFINGPFPFEDEGLGWRASTNGKWAVVGTKAGNVVHLYYKNSTVWTYNTTLTEPMISPNNRYGYAVHITPDNLLIVCDERYFNTPISRGACFTYRRQGGDWQLWATYTDDGSIFNSHFGAAVDANDEYILIGIPNAPPHGKCMLIERDVEPCFGCDGNYNSCAMFDACGICGGFGETCLGCDGVPLSNKTIDGCGVCGGFNDTCILIEPEIFNITCNTNQFDPLNKTTIEFQTFFNDTIAKNFTLNTFPTFSNWTFDSSTGIMMVTPPLLFSGAIAINVSVCYVETAAVVPLECQTKPVVQDGASCQGYVPPGPILTFEDEDSMQQLPLCNNTLMAINVVNCTDCMGMGGGVVIFDECGVCGGDGSSCAGCDGIPNSGAMFDYCGVCEGTNTTCLDIFTLPFVAGPCDPYCIFLGHEPAQNAVFYQVITPPVYGTAVLNAYTGVIKYTPPNSFMGLPPNDIMTVKGTDNFMNMDTEMVVIPFALFVLDACGLCGGDNSTCAGCDGVPNSGLVFDRCGICGGDGSTCPGVRTCGVWCVFFAIIPWIYVIFLLIILGMIYRCISHFVKMRCRLRSFVTPRPAQFVYDSKVYDLAPGLDVSEADYR